MPHESLGTIRPAARTTAEIYDSTSHGMLYLVAGIHGTRVRCFRMRRRGGKLLVCRDERITLCPTPGDAPDCVPGDFVFQDPDGRFAIWRDARLSNFDQSGIVIPSEV